MEVDVTFRLEEVHFAPPDLVTEIIQNIRTIFTTPKYSVPLDRLFGVDARVVDYPTPRAMAALTADIVEAIHKYEPRCRVIRVDFEGDADGILRPKVRVKIHEE